MLQIDFERGGGGGGEYLVAMLSVISSLILFMYFYGLKQGPLVQGHLGPRDLCLNKLGKGPQGLQCYIRNFKHLSQVILKKKISEYFLYFFYGSA